MKQATQTKNRFWGTEDAERGSFQKENFPRKKAGRRIAAVCFFLSAVLLLLSAAGCSVKLYDLGTLLPELIDTSTQYPYIERIVIEDLESGKSVEITDGGEFDRIRMQFEGVQCIREKTTGTLEYQYSVSFYTTDGRTVVMIGKPEFSSYVAYRFTIGGYDYDSLLDGGTGVDTTVFAGFFAES